MSVEPDPHRARQVLAITCGATFMAALDATIANGPVAQRGHEGGRA